MRIRHATCACGQLRLACEGEPVRVSVCHCFECQRRTGSAFGVQARFRRERVTRIEGRAAQFSRVAESDKRIDFHFCPTCGSTVYWEAEAVPELIAVAVGAFADPISRRPRFPSGRGGGIPGSSCPKTSPCSIRIRARAVIAMSEATKRSGIGNASSGRSWPPRAIPPDAHARSPPSAGANSVAAKSSPTKSSGASRDLARRKRTHRRNCACRHGPCRGHGQCAPAGRAAPAPRRRAPGRCRPRSGRRRIVDRLQPIRRRPASTVPISR